MIPVYHLFVKAKLRHAFASISAGRYDGVLADFAPAHDHVFYGEHALAGRRRDLDRTRAWYGRLARVFPDLRFEIRSIAVTGWPWDTVAAVEWTDHFTIDGVAGHNQGVHMLRLKWGRVVGLDIHCDTQKLARYLAAKAAGGLAEAVAAPIAS